MSLTGIIVVFVIVWWLCFFVVLPIGVRGQHEDGEITPGSEAGAPVNPNLKFKALLATCGGGVITGLLFVASHIFDFHALLGGV